MNGCFKSAATNYMDAIVRDGEDQLKACGLC